MLSYTFRQEFEDVFDATRAMLKRPGPARVSGYVLLFAPALVLGTALLRHWTPAAAARFTLPVFLACWGMYFLGRPLACWLMARSAQRRAAAAGLERTVTLDDQGVELTTSRGAARIPWDGFTAVGETPKVFLLYVSSERVLILPKRALGPDSGAAAVREMIGARILRPRR
jgi:hypothetical protein